MPSRYPVEVRRQVVELARSGTKVSQLAEIWHNTRRRHSALNMLTPSEYENQHQQRQIAA